MTLFNNFLLLTGEEGSGYAWRIRISGPTFCNSEAECIRGGRSRDEKSVRC